MNSNDLLNFPTAKLKRILVLKNQIARLEARLQKLAAGALSGPAGKPGRKRRKMSAAGRRRISLAAKARWARIRAGKGK